MFGHSPTTVMTDAIKRYVNDVKTGDFPNENECY